MDPGEPGDWRGGGGGGCDGKVSQTTLGTSQQQNLGIEAREPGAVLGPSPDGAARRASARACCHRVEACPDGSRGTPPGPHWTLSCPGSLRPQAAGLSGPRWPWQRSWLICHILGGPRVGARSWRAMGGLNGQTYLKGLSEKIGSVCVRGGGGWGWRKCLPGGQTQTPALPHPGLAACSLLTNPGERLPVLRAHRHTLTAALAFHLASPLPHPSQQHPVSQRAGFLSEEGEGGEERGAEPSGWPQTQDAVCIPLLLQLTLECPGPLPRLPLPPTGAAVASLQQPTH